MSPSRSSLHPTTKKRHDFEMEAFSSTSNISAKSLSNLKANIGFGILRTSWFRNCPCWLDLTKNWQRYWGLKRWLPFQNQLVFLSSGVQYEVEVLKSGGLELNTFQSFTMSILTERKDTRLLTLSAQNFYITRHTINFISSINGLIL